MRLPALALTISLLLPISWQAGTAACGPIPSLESASRSAAAVFVGTASAVSPTSDDVVFDVAWQWKGEPAPATVTVSVAAADTVTTSAASRTFANGRAYLVFTENGSAPFIIDACNPAPAYVADGSVIPSFHRPAVLNYILNQSADWSAAGANEYQNLAASFAFFSSTPAAARDVSIKSTGNGSNFTT